MTMATKGEDGSRTVSTAVESDPAARSLAERRAANEGALRVLEAILAQDPLEQQQAWERFKHAIDEDRPDGHKLFA